VKRIALISPRQCTYIPVHSQSLVIVYFRYRSDQFYFAIRLIDLHYSRSLTTFFVRFLRKSTRCSIMEKTRARHRPCNYSITSIVHGRLAFLVNVAITGTLTVPLMRPLCQIEFLKTEPLVAGSCPNLRHSREIFASHAFSNFNTAIRC